MVSVRVCVCVCTSSGWTGSRSSQPCTPSLLHHPSSPLKPLLKGHPHIPTSSGQFSVHLVLILSAALATAHCSLFLENFPP